MRQVVKQLVIHGKVQGVCYRSSMVSEARRLGISGWVRNRRDGTVEAMCSGNEEAVTDLIAWAHQGPEGARVERVEIGEGEGAFSIFEQIGTA